MKSRRLELTIFLLLVAGIAVWSQTYTRVKASTPFTVNGVGLDMSLSDVESVLGAPVGEQRRACTVCGLRNWAKDRCQQHEQTRPLFFIIMDGKVAYVKGTGLELNGEPWLDEGDPVSKINELLGRNDVSPDFDQGRSSTRLTNQVTVFSNDGRVSEVASF